MPSFFSCFKSENKYEKWDTEKIKDKIQECKRSIELLNKESQKSNSYNMCIPPEMGYTCSIEFFYINSFINQLERKVEKLSAIISAREPDSLKQLSQHRAG